MNFIDVCFFSLLLVIFYVYSKIYNYFYKSNSKILLKWMVGIIVTGGLFAIIHFAYIGLEITKDSEYSIGYPIGITLLMWLFRNILHRDTSERFKSEGHDNPLQKKFKQVAETDDEFIPIYPRVTIWETNSKNDKDSKVIFDSSDFTVINKNFGVFDKRPQSIFNGGKFSLNQIWYYVSRVDVIFYDLYDDYSQNSHTSAYEGENTPYNLQIIIIAQQTNSAHNPIKLIEL